MAWLAFAAAAYAISLIATAPAALLFRTPPTMSLEGAIWRGRVTLPGSHALVWTTDIPRSLLTLSFAVDWSLTGPGSELEGRARFRPASVTIERVSGRASSPLVRALAPGLPFPCDGEARIDARRLRWTRSGFDADAELRSAPASCPMGKGAPLTAPALLALLTSANGALSARVATSAAPAVTLATASLDPTGRLVAELRPEAGGVLPGVPRTAANASPFRLETTVKLP